MTRNIACIGFAATAITASGQGKIETEITLDFASKYVDDGLTYVNAPVFQPGITFTAGRFTLGFWGNVELNGWNEPNYNSNRRGAFSEIDSWLEYAWAWKGTEWFAGCVDYQFPGTGNQQYQDWYVGMTAPNFVGAPNLTIYRGSRAFTGSYAVLTLSHSLAVSGRSFDIGADVSYGDARTNEFYYGNRRAALGYIHFSAQTEFALGPNWQLIPSVHYSTLLHRDHLAGEPRRTNAWFQIGLKTSF